MADRDERNREMMQRYGTTYDDYVILADHAVAYLCGLPPAYRTGFDLDAVVRAIERGRYASLFFLHLPFSVVHESEKERISLRC